jgi:hypothetical protein
VCMSGGVVRGVGVGERVTVHIVRVWWWVLVRV